MTAAIHFYFTGFGFPEPLKLASLHLLLAIPPLFLLYPAVQSSPQTRPSAIDWLLAAAALAPSLYIYLNPDGSTAEARSSTRSARLRWFWERPWCC